MFCSTVRLYSQDTLSIYFEFGKSKITDTQFNILNTIPIQYDVLMLDSVSFIGMADSVGDFNSNKKLSEKRAKNIAKECIRIFKNNIPSTITSLGERNNKAIDRNRRVDIVMFFKAIEKEEIESIENIDVLKKCFNIDYKLLHHCYIRTITKHKKSFVIIETTRLDLSKKRVYYYGTTSPAGKFITTKVKWIIRRTGKSWWAATRFVATIPKKDFESFKIFTISDLPCDSCDEDYKIQPKFLNNDTCKQVDRFLMDNIQFKSSFFNKRTIKIRVPKEYVDINANYYIGCNFKTKLKWQHQIGKKKQNYYYSTLPIYFDYISNIVKDMDCCKNNIEPSDCSLPIIRCRMMRGADKSFALMLDVGSYYQQSQVLAYGALGIYKDGDFSRTAFQMGIDNKFCLITSISYQYHFLSIPFDFLKTSLSWHSPDRDGDISKYARFYFGTELKTFLKKESKNSIEQNVHVGFTAVNTSENTIIPRIFIQYGMGYDYLNSNSKKIYSIAKLGVILRITRF
jgi:hypothetical protein